MRRAGGVIAGVVVGLVTLVLVGVFLYGWGHTGSVILLIVGGVLFVAGLWCAWRVATGRWGLWLGRSGHPIAAFLAALLLAVAVSAGLLVGLWAVRRQEDLPDWAWDLVWAFLAAAWVGIFWVAWRVGTKRRGEHAPVSPSPDLPFRHPAAPSAGPHSRPVSPPDPARFVPGPGCGRTVNRQVGCCPYCQTVVEGGS